MGGDLLIVISVLTELHGEKLLGFVAVTCLRIFTSVLAMAPTVIALVLVGPGLVDRIIDNVMINYWYVRRYCTVRTRTGTPATTDHGGS